MSKNMKKYIISWVSTLVLFNVICFVTPKTIGGVDKFDGGFWPCYGMVTAAFVLHLLLTWKVLGGNIDRPHKSSLLAVSSLELTLMVIAGFVCIFVPSIPAWAGVIACAAILAFSLIFIMTTSSVNENLEVSNANLNAKTSRIRHLTDEAALLENYAKDGQSKVIAKKVYEALRYSDPVTSPEIVELDEEIEFKLTHLSRLFIDGDTLVESQATELLTLIDRRRVKCKADKRRI